MSNFSPNLNLMHYFIFGDFDPSSQVFKPSKACRGSDLLLIIMHYIRYGAVSGIPGWYWEGELIAQASDSN